jgi:tetratricopeptide (TPR) repeat protein
MVPPERKAELYYLLASCIYDQKKYIKAIKYCKMADKNISPDSRKTFLMAKIYDVWADSLVNLGKRKEALAIKKKCIEFAKKDGRYASFIGQAMFYTGINYMELDNYSEAKKYLMDALAIFRKLDKSGIAWQGSAYLFLAHNARYHNKWKEAETYYEKATVLFEKILFNKNVKNKFSKKSMDMAFIGICKAYKWLQFCFYKNSHQQKAILIYAKIKKLDDKSITNFIVDIYPGIISNYMDLKKYKQAHVLIEEALRLYESFELNKENLDNIATLWWLKANVYNLSGNTPRAIIAGKKACTILNKISKNNIRNKRILKILKTWQISRK